MKVKVGDTVKIIAGKDKGKEGKIIATLRKNDKVVVEGCNIIKKHQKPNNANENGGIFERENPIHVSNVKVLTKVQKDTKKKIEKETPKKEVKKTTKAKTTAKKEGAK